MAWNQLVQKEVEWQDGMEPVSPKEVEWQDGMEPASPKGSRVAGWHGTS